MGSGGWVVGVNCSAAGLQIGVYRIGGKNPRRCKILQKTAKPCYGGTIFSDIERRGVNELLEDGLKDYSIAVNMMSDPAEGAPWGFCAFAKNVSGGRSYSR